MACSGTEGAHALCEGPTGHSGKPQQPPEDAEPRGRPERAVPWHPSNKWWTDRKTHLKEKRFYKAIKTLNPQQNISFNSLRKTKDLNRHFPKEHTQMANGHLGRCSTSLGTREMHTKPTRTHYLTPPTMVLLKKADNNKRW